jgi:hypothetical protein
MLNDPYLFNNNGEITTKEILKRFQDRQGQRASGHASDSSEVPYNRQDMSTRPPPRRVDTDPSLWQQESTAQRMQEPSLPYTNPGQSTPPQAWRARDEGPGHLSPYNQQFDSDPQLTPGDGDSQRREWRNSGRGYQNSGVTMGNNF